MSTKEFSIKGIKLTILKKPEFEMVGFKRPVNFGDGSIGRFIRELNETGKMQKLAETLAAPQQIWVCLSDCQSCGLGCSGFQACCRICVEKTEHHDFSKIRENEISEIRLPTSEWVLY